MKSVLKEISIMLLLCAAILLILGVLFYDYIPTNKIIPNKLEAYKTPENIKEEIEENITELPKQNYVYEITGSDLNVYKKSQSYDPGKPDPFGAYTATTNEGNNTGTGNNTSSNENTNANTNSGSSGTFFNDTGLK